MPGKAAAGLKKMSGAKGLAKGAKKTLNVNKNSITEVKSKSVEPTSQKTGKRGKIILL